MNKMISFRDLIDLEPKPKKVKCYDNYKGFEFDGLCYCNDETTLEEILNIYEMSKPIIEIIEEDKPRIEKVFKIRIDGDEIICSSNTYSIISLENKINELCDIINDMEKK